MKRKYLFFLLTAIVILLFAGLLKFRSSLYGIEQPVGETLEILPDTNGQEIAAVLFDKKIISNKKYFLRYIRKHHLDGRLKAGVYEFSGKPFLPDVTKMLVRGEIARLKFTIPEGATCREMGEILENNKICTVGEFEEFAEKEKLEGYLFPDTYVFPLKISKEAVAKRMIDRFWEIMQDIYPEAASMKQEQLKKIVTIASIIEKEAGLDSDRPIVASVFYNRLNRRMALQSCATIKYVIGNKKYVTIADTRIRSPYNTYNRKGLPPTPICNPGRLSLKAAIYPFRTSYLFFLAKGDGSHCFSTNYADHKKAKEMYIDNRFSSETDIAE